MSEQQLTAYPVLGTAVRELWRVAAHLIKLTSRKGKEVCEKMYKTQQTLYP